MKYNKEVIADNIKEGKFFTTEELKNRIAKMDINQLDYLQHDRKHYEELYDRMILIKENRDILLFYLKIDPLIFQKKTKRKLSRTKSIESEGKISKNNLLDSNQGNKIGSPPSEIFKQLIPSKKATFQEHLPKLIINGNQPTRKRDPKAFSHMLEKIEDSKLEESSFKRIVDLEKSWEETEHTNDLKSNAFFNKKEQFIKKEKDKIPNNCPNKNFFMDFVPQNSMLRKPPVDLASENKSIDTIKPKEISINNIDNKPNGLRHFKFNFRNTDFSQSQQSIDANYERKIKSISTNQNDSDKKVENKYKSYDFSLSSNQNDLIPENQLIQDQNNKINNVKTIIEISNDEENQDKDKIKFNKHYNDNEYKKENVPIIEIEKNYKKEIDLKESNFINKSLKEKFNNFKNQSDFKCSTSCISIEIPSSSNSLKKTNSNTSTQIHSKSQCFEIKDYARFSLYFVVLTLSVFLLYLYLNNKGNLTQYSSYDIMISPFINILTPNDILSRYWMYIIIIVLYYVLFKRYYNHYKNLNLAKKIFEKLCEELKIMYNEENYENGMTEEQIITIHSTENNVSQDFFRLNIFPLLKDMRRKNQNIREFEKQENGKYKRVWQWSG